MEINKVFVVMIQKERSQYQAALEAFDNRDSAEKSVQHQVKQGGVRAWIEEIPAHIESKHITFTTQGERHDKQRSPGAVTHAPPA